MLSKAARRWKLLNPGKVRMYRRKHMAKYRRTLYGRFSAARTSARSSGTKWKLTFAAYCRLATKCTYCQGVLPETGSGLDRKQNSAGYVAGNVVPCCTCCNLIKGNRFTFKEMCLLGPALCKIRRTREKQGKPLPYQRTWGKRDKPRKD